MKKILVLLAIMLLLLTACETEQGPYRPPTRESRLTGNMTKVDPADDPYPPIMNSTGWQKPIPVSYLINTPGAEDSAFVTPDGKELYFFFTPDPNISPEKQLLDEVTGIYVSKKVNGEWSYPTRVMLQKQGKLALDGCEFVQGDRMWFCSAREGYTGVNFFIAQRINNEWKNPVYAGDKL
ncbi:MAG: hypothetical protein ABIE94_01205, partial [archaeon]